MSFFVLMLSMNFLLMALAEDEVVVMLATTDRLSSK
jgi:hypothetical protein